MSNKHYYFGAAGETFVRPLRARLQATFSSGVATKDTSGRLSDPSATIVKDSTGDYDIAGLPTGKGVHVHCSLDPGADSPPTDEGVLCAPRSFSASAGTGKVLFTRPDTGALADPPDGSRLFLTVFVEEG